MTRPIERSSSVNEFAQAYKGIEYFYLLSKRGHLGYLRSDLIAIRESFAKKGSKDPVSQNPDFPKELETFNRITVRLVSKYLENPKSGMELGYLLPARPSGQRWQSASLVLNPETVTHIVCEVDVAYESGNKDPFRRDADKDVENIRSLQQGLDALINHRNRFGTHSFFPVLFLLPQGTSLDVMRPEYPVRVLNLLWKPSVTRDTMTTYGYEGCPAVFDALRHNLHVRGAINRKLRVENKFSLE